MNCSKCGNLNNQNSKFCVKCGAALGASTAPNTVPTMNTQNNVVQGFNNQIQNVNNPQQATTPNNSKPFLNFVKYIINALIKPVKTFKNEEEKLADVKNSFILSGIVAFVMMLIKLITSIINVIVVKEYDYDLNKFKTSIKFDGLEYLDFGSLIFKTLLINLIIILAIAGVYYIASLVAKKTTNFSKILSATATSFLPSIVICSILSPILGKIWLELQIIVYIVGIVYSLIMFITLINENIKIENPDISIYYHLASISILVIIGYFVIMNSMPSELEITDMMNLLN